MLGEEVGFQREVEQPVQLRRAESPMPMIKRRFMILNFFMILFNKQSTDL